MSGLKSVVAPVIEINSLALPIAAGDACWALAKDLNQIATQIRTDLQPRFSELTEEVARLYAANFTEQELKDILAFYKTTAGKKLLAEQPKVVDTSMKFAQDWANKLSDQVIAKMRDELKKRGHAL